MKRPAIVVLAAALVCGAVVSVVVLLRTDGRPWAPIGVDVGGIRVIDTLDFVLQRNDRDCGVAAVAMLLKEMGVAVPYDTLLQAVTLTRRGLSLQALADLAARHGVELRGYRFTSLDPRVSETPWIARIGRGRFAHYVVIEHVTSAEVTVLDPRVGRVAYALAPFMRVWSGYALLPAHHIREARRTFGASLERRRPPESQALGYRARPTRFTLSPSCSMIHPSTASQNAMCASRSSSPA